MHLHPELDTGHDPNALTSRTRQRTRSQTIYTPLHPHTILTYFIHRSYSQNPNSPHPPIILPRYFCLTSPVGVKLYFLPGFTIIWSHTFRTIRRAPGLQYAWQHEVTIINLHERNDDKLAPGGIRTSDPSTQVPPTK